ncbi:MAG: type II toxin-antitoxin system RelE/ParE family toxin [Burkholderiales bacterium]
MNAYLQRLNPGQLTCLLTMRDLPSFWLNTVRAFDCRTLALFGGGLFELRPRGPAGIGRAFYCFMVGKRITILHAFIKKTQATPDRELKLARKRQKELQGG